MTDVAEAEGGQCQCLSCVAKRQTKRVRLWRWLARLDLTKPPAPVLRWLGILLIAVVYVAVGAPTQLGDWLWPAILAGALILPDVAGFGIAGVRLDLKQAQDEIATLRQDVKAQARSSSTSIVNIDSREIAEAISATVREVLQVIIDQQNAAATATRWEDPGDTAVDTQPPQDVTSEP